MVRKGEIEGRIEPFYYVPEIVELEKKVRKVSAKRLKDFIVSLASGATPAVREEEKFYSNAENGVPFIRVQNLSYTNELMLNDLKYINQETHQKYLNRSQIRQGDLLVKITGVGRMAVSSVVPNNFEGNINQHLVVIKTADRLTSEVLATFLNTDIAEKLASRRATGGTRPALDYTALKSMPIVFKPEIVEVVKNAVVAKRQKEAEAAALLASIDGYLLQALGITLPPPSAKQPFFYTHAQKVSGGRFDPFFHQNEFDANNGVVQHGRYKAVHLKQAIQTLVKGRLPKNEEKDGQLKVVQINSINFDGHIDVSDLLTAKAIFTPEQQMQKNDVLVVITGATIGKVAIWEREENKDYFLGGDIVKFQCLEQVNPHFVFAWLRCQNAQIEIKRNVTGATNGHLSPSDIANILIPLPPLETQTAIANHISALRAQAKQLQQQAEAELAHAKQQVEKLILGES